MARRDAPLTTRQREFVRHYIECWSATEAVKRAGYSAKGASVQGSMLLRNPRVADEIRRIQREIQAGPEDIMYLLSDHMHCDVRDFLTEDGRLNMATLADPRKSRRLKKIRWSEDGSVTIELHDSQSAAVALARCQKLGGETVQHTGPGGGPIQVEAVQRVMREEREQIQAAEQRIAALLAARQGVDPSVAAQHNSAKAGHGGNGGNGNGGNGSGGNGNGHH